MELIKKTKRGRPSKVDKIPKVGKGGGNIDSFIKQLQKNKLYSEAEKLMDGDGGEKQI